MTRGITPAITIKQIISPECHVKKSKDLTETWGGCGVFSSFSLAFLFVLFFDRMERLFPKSEEASQAKRALDGYVQCHWFMQLFHKSQNPLGTANSGYSSCHSSLGAF